jgi:hypothetical protein
MGSRVEPRETVAGLLRSRRELVLNWFHDTAFMRTPRVDEGCAHVGPSARVRQGIEWGKTVYGLADNCQQKSVA